MKTKYAKLIAVITLVSILLVTAAPGLWAEEINIGGPGEDLKGDIVQTGGDDQDQDGDDQDQDGDDQDQDGDDQDQDGDDQNQGGDDQNQDVDDQDQGGDGQDQGDDGLGGGKGVDGLGGDTGDGVLGIMGASLMASGSNLSLSATAGCRKESRIDLDWSLTKTADPVALTLEPTQTEDVTFTVTASAVEGTPQTAYVAHGLVTVTNNGSVPTENLTISGRMQCERWLIVWYWDSFGSAFTVDTSAMPILAAGQSYEYPYSVEFIPETGIFGILNHRVKISASVTNGPDPEIKREFGIPSQSIDVYTNGAIEVIDAISCPEGFSCEPSAIEPWPISYQHGTPSYTKTYTIELTNDDAVWGDEWLFTNTVFSGTEISAVAPVTVYTGENTPPEYTPLAVAQTDEACVETDIKLGSFADADIETWQITVDWGDGSSTEVFNKKKTGNIGKKPHTYSAVGNYPVTVTVTDSVGNSDYDVFTVAVVDETPPALTLPGDRTVEATGPDGAVVEYTASAVDLVDGVVPVACSQASGSVFPLGTTTVTCTATDAAGNTASGTFDVTVEDTTAPKLTLPGNLIVEATGPDGAVVEYTVSAYDLVDGVVPVICAQNSGSVFPLGTTTVTCYATDTRGNAVNSFFNITVRDTTAPSIGFGVVPPKWINCNFAYFSWSGSDLVTLPGGLLYQYKKDNGAWSNWKSQNDYFWNFINQGRHTFAVRAKDAVGNTSAVIEHVFWVDVTAPSVDFDHEPDNWINQTTAFFDWHGNDAFPHPSDLEYRHRRDEGQWSDWSDGPSQAWWFNLSQGHHTFEVQARDAAGNISRIARSGFTVDLTSPVVILDQQPGEWINTTTASFAWHGEDGYPQGSILKYQYRLDNGWWSWLSGATSFTWKNLHQGTHTFEVAVVDVAGNRNTVKCIFKVDRTDPTVVFDSQPGDWVNTDKVNFAWHGEDDYPEGSVMQYQWKLDAGEWPEGWSADTSVEITGLAEGEHTFFVKVKDAAGNESEVLSDSFTVDLTVPAVAIDTHPAEWINVDSATFTWHGEDGFPPESMLEYQWMLAGAEGEGDADWSDWSGATEATVEELAEGCYTFSVRTRDAAGNISEAVEYIFNVDLTAPVVNIVNPVDGGHYKTEALPEELVYEVTEANAYTAEVAGYSKEEGTHSASVTVVDAAGNVGTAEITYIVDNTAPVLTIPENIVEITSQSEAEITFTVSAVDEVDGPVAVTVNYPSGTMFPRGRTTVVCFASDLAGNTVEGAFVVTVRNSIDSRERVELLLEPEAVVPSLPGALTIILTEGSDKVLVNAEEVTIAAAPYMNEEAGRLMIPLRFVSEQLGAYVDWNETAQQVRIELDGKVIILTVGSKIVTVDGVEVEIDAPAALANGSAFVPLRFVSETLGATVEWDDVAKTATITKAAAAAAEEEQE